MAGNGSQGVSQPDEQKNKPQSGLQDATDAMKSLVLGGGDAPEDVLQNSQDMMVAIATQPGEKITVDLKHAQTWMKNNMQ